MRLLLLFLVALMASSVTYALVAHDNGPGDALKATVVVVCGNTAYGTGWWVNPGHVVTAYHVVEGCNNITLVRGGYTSPASIVAYNETLDVAVLRAILPPQWEPVTLDLARKVEVGDEVWVIGYPIQLYMETGDIVEMSISPRANEGRVVWLSPNGLHAEISAYTDKGNSGGPVVNSDGHVTGIIVYARPGAVSSSYYMLTAPAIADFLDGAGVEYSVAQWWESRPFLVLALGGLAPLGLVLFLGGGRR